MTTKKGPGRPAAQPNTRLVKLLERAGMTQAELAGKLGLSKQAVNYWCDIGVPALRCEKVAKVVKCSLRELRPDVFGRA
jgi:DNA-binding transcriptional regulator YdaS (Cro superfamily)